MFNEEMRYENPIKQMREIANLSEQLGSHFRSKSPLWKAIWDHIAHAKDCVLIDRKSCVSVHRGTGHSINFMDLYACKDYSKLPAVEADFFAIQLYVDYYDEEEDRDNMVKYTVNAPTELALNFTQKGFKEWIVSVKKERDAERNENDLKELERLVKKFPKKASSLVS